MTAILPNKSQCGRPLWLIACIVHWENGIHKNWGTALSKRKRKPRVALKANSRCASQDPLSQEARSSQSPRETGCNIVYCIVPGIYLSTVQQQDEQKQHTVAKLILKFESHQHKGLFVKDMSDTQKINRFSGASQKIAARYGPDRDLRTLWEFYETSMVRMQLFHGTRINLLQLWTKVESRGVPQHFKKVTTVSIRKHRQSERHIMFFKATNMLRKAKNKKKGNHPTILSRWKADEEYRKSLGFFGTGQKEIMLYDQVAL